MFPRRLRRLICETKTNYHSCTKICHNLQRLLTMEQVKPDALQTTLTQIVKKETRHCQTIQSGEQESLYHDDVLIGQDVRRLLTLPGYAEVTNAEPVNNCVTPVGKI